MNARLCVLVVVASAVLSGCMGARYLPQAALGQARLMTTGTRLEKAIEDPATPPHVAALLGEVQPVLAFGSARGLHHSRSYQRYVEFDRDYVVWLVTGSDPLAFEPKVYWFPIVGSFAGVGWFREERGARHVARLERHGFDAACRGAVAYSTGGWFRDPVVSSMLRTGPAAVGDFANTLLHEALHATVLINGQTYFNESLASFVADTMTPEYLAQRLGPDAVELSAYLDLVRRQRRYERLVLAAYSELETLYSSPLDAAAKLDQKRAILNQLQQELQLSDPPNNATLLGAKLYGSDLSSFQQLLVACAGNWGRFLDAVGSLRRHHFSAPQQERFGPVLENLIAWRCEPLPR